MAVGDVYRLAVQLRRETDPFTCVNVFHLRQEAPLILDTPGEDLVDAFRSIVETDYLNLFTNLLTIYRYSVAKAPLFLTEYFVDVVVPGALTGEGLPPRTSAVITWRTADLTRRGRGRTFLPPATEGSSTGSGVTGGYLADMQDFISKYLTVLPADIITHAGWLPGIWSTADQLFKPIISSTANLRWKSQRDRLNLY